MIGYVTEAQIRRDIVRSLQSAVTEEEERAKEAEREGKTIKRRYSMAALDTPQYRRWIEDRIEDKRKRGLVVSDQQLADLKAGRKLQEGDLARFIGKTRIEDTRGGKSYTRPHGQVGTITQVVKTADGRALVTFMPKVDPAALDPGGPTVFVARFEVKEGTKGYFLLERIPSARERANDPNEGQGLTQEELDQVAIDLQRLADEGKA